MIASIKIGITHSDLPIRNSQHALIAHAGFKGCAHAQDEAISAAPGIQADFGEICAYHIGPDTRPYRVLEQLKVRVDKAFEPQIQDHGDDTYGIPQDAQ